MTAYLKSVLCIVLFIVVAGFLAPALISSKSNEGVILGFGLLAALPIAIYFIVRHGKATNHVET